MRSAVLPMLVFAFLFLLLEVGSIPLPREDIAGADAVNEDDLLEFEKLLRTQTLHRRTKRSVPCSTMAEDSDCNWAELAKPCECESCELAKCANEATVTAKMLRKQHLKKLIERTINRLKRKLHAVKQPPCNPCTRPCDPCNKPRVDVTVVVPPNQNPVPFKTVAEVTNEYGMPRPPYGMPPPNEMTGIPYGMPPPEMPEASYGMPPYGMPQGYGRRGNGMQMGAQSIQVYNEPYENAGPMPGYGQNLWSRSSVSSMDENAEENVPGSPMPVYDEPNMDLLSRSSIPSTDGNAETGVSTGGSDNQARPASDPDFRRDGNGGAGSVERDMRTEGNEESFKSNEGESVAPSRGPAPIARASILPEDTAEKTGLASRRSVSETKLWWRKK